MCRVDFYVLWSVLEAPRQLFRSLVCDGEWSLDMVMECLKLSAQGKPAKLCLSVSEKVSEGSGSSAPARRRLSTGPPSSPMLSESTIAQVLEQVVEQVQGPHYLEI